MASFLKSISKGSSNVLTPHLKAYFGAGNFGDELVIPPIGRNKAKDDAFHPSSADRCAREEFALRTGDYKPDKPDAGLATIFFVGHLFHAALGALLTDELKFSQPDDIEAPFEHRGLVTDEGNEWWVRGHTDVRSCIIPGSGEWMVDLKTQGGYQFTLDPSPQSPHWEAQAQVYMHEFQKERLILLRWQKETPHDFKEIHYFYDPEKVAEIYGRWADTVDALAANRIPDCTCAQPEKCPVKGLYV